MPKQQKKTLKRSKAAAAKPGGMAERVRAAFEAARQGDLQPSAELADKGRAVMSWWLISAVAQEHSGKPRPARSWV